MNLYRTPPLNAVRAFEAAARLGSYVAASQALHVTQPAIGRHVKILEEWLDVQLFNRTSRGVTLTAEGAEYFKAVTKAFELLAEAGASVSKKPEERWLRIICAPAFASRWLTPRIAQLRRLRPGLKISIEPNFSFTSVDPARADLGIAYGLAESLPASKELLIKPLAFPVCSPAFLASLSSKPTLADLASCQLTHTDHGNYWNAWFAAKGLNTRVSTDISHVSADVVLNQAQRGLGIALANELLVATELIDGSLIRCPEESALMGGYYLLTPPQAMAESTEWFINWIRNTLMEAFPNSTFKE